MDLVSSTVARSYDWDFSVLLIWNGFSYLGLWCYAHASTRRGVLMADHDTLDFWLRAPLNRVLY